ncbi:LANO_0H20010g1_1 [Lachancea nothofagi CBS 11611]|uniref:LANO_0H20010g1_1 n=1 Tax=Lachancea nothofagi CBS 11611 TaxID=1266666 RepID=A0A1G4KN76_9SACH|nr:LANO_0H20010g1_1 [Lachancea nothofagi CBS 11611]
MSGYDRALSIFSPDGHIFQVEYALEAVKRGTCAVGIKGTDCVVVGCERRSTLKLQDPRITPSKISKIDSHVVLSFAGLNADSRILIEKARVEAQSHKLTLEDPVSVDYLTRYVAGVQQKYTQSGGVRPFGVSTLIAGFDPRDTQPKLYQTEPSGIYSAWSAQAIGRNSKTVREFLEKNYVKGQPPATEQLCVKLTVKALLEVVQTGAKNIEITVVRPDSKIISLSSEDIGKYVDEIEQEKQQELEKKKKKRGEN